MGNVWVASSEREKDFPSNRLLLLQRGKLAAVIGFLLRYTAITLPTVYKLLQALQSQKGRAHRRMYVPSLFVSNVMSLPPKGDELRHAVMYATLDLVCITESWLKRHIHDKVVAPDSYNIIRRDRSETEHGGVCMCINNTVKFTVVDDLDDSSFEVLWIQISPICLLRGYSSILPGVFYHSPSGNDSVFLEYLRGVCHLLKHGGDNLKRRVNFPTRGERTVDSVLTNLQDDYESPTQRPPLGLLDHMSIDVQPKMRIKSNSSTTTTIQSRDMRSSKRLAMRTYLESVGLDTILNSADNCEGKTSLLEQIIETGLDHIIPMRERKVHSTEPPWITSSLKTDDDQMFNELRNRFNLERRMCRANYYQAKVEHLKKCKPSEWCKEVKKLSGHSLASTAQSDTLKWLQHLHH